MKKLASFLIAALMLFALMVPASADMEFTESVEQKPAPEIVFLVDESGNVVPAIITNDDGTQVYSLDPSELIITPISEVDEAPEEIREVLTNAYQQLQETPDVDQLVPEVSLVEILQKMGSSSKVEDLVVRDIFDVSVTGKAAEHLSPDDQYITIRFDLGISPTATLIVLHNYEADKWEYIPYDQVTINNDGTVDVKFYSLSPVAFVVDKTETDTSASTDANAPTSPQTGDESGFPVAGAGLMVLGCAAVASAVVVWKKRVRN